MCADSLDISKMETANQRHSPSLFWKRVKSLLVVSSVLGLGSCNVATLVSEQAHNIGFNMLRSCLGSVMAESAVSRILSNSPVIRRQNDVTIATKRLNDEKAAMARKEKQRSVAVKQLSRRIAQRSVRNVTRNVSAVAGESIPILGTALIIGVTVLDVRDACANIREMNEVNRIYGQPSEDERICDWKVPSRAEVLNSVRNNWQSAYTQTASTLENMVPTSAPKLSFSEVKENVCPITGGYFCR